MNGSAETRRSQKVGKSIQWTSPRVPSKRRREKQETVPLCDKSSQDAKEQSIRGNVVQELWEATQRTVKLIMPESGNRNQESMANETNSPQPQDVPVNDPVFSPMGCIARRGNRNPPNERKKHFQMVMAELKSKTRTKNNCKDSLVGPFPKGKESPTTIHCVLSNDSEGGLDPVGVPQNSFENSFLYSPEQGTQGSIKNWLPKPAMFQKGTCAAERSQSGSTHISKRPFRSFSPGNKSTFVPRANMGTEDVMEDENGLNCHGIRTAGTSLGGADVASHFRRGNRFMLPFRRKGAFEMLKRSRSVGLDGFSFQVHELFEESADMETLDPVLNPPILTQVQELLSILEWSEDHLAILRIQGERNTFELRSEMRRLKQMVSSLTHTQERRYRSLLETLNENYRTLGQVESGFDYFHMLMNRQERSSIRYKFSRLIWFFLDHTVASLLMIVYVTTSIYSHYRFKRRIARKERK